MFVYLACARSRKKLFAQVLSIYRILSRTQITLRAERVFLLSSFYYMLFRARDCSGVMCPGIRFVHNYPIRAHILVRARIRAPFIIGRAEKRLGVLPRSDGALPSRCSHSETIEFGVGARALRSAQTIKSIFAGEAAVYLSIAMYYMRAVYDVFEELHI